jgi:hypothetical protein
MIRDRIVQQFTYFISEEEFDFIHKVAATVYGFVDKPQLMPDIISEVDRMIRTNTAEKYDRKRMVKEIAAFRTL